MKRVIALAFAISTASLAPALGEETGSATAIPATMEEVEAAYLGENFPAARAGLKQLAETAPTGGVAYRYGRILLDPRSGEVDTVEAVKWLEFAVQQDHMAAPTLLARILLTGNAVPRDAERAGQLLQDSATRGDQEAQYYLALLFLAGEGVAQSDRDAFVWFRAAAEQGHVEAAYELSRLFSKGQGTELDTKKALDWLRRAAGDGHVQAQFFLANALETGQGAKQNRNEALDWYRRAADGGHILSMRIIGTKYLQGEGVYADGEAAVHWLRKAADGGEPGALYNLSLLYGKGQVVARDDDEAYRLMEQAAMTGLPRAIGMQAAFLEAGRGAEADLERAVGLYVKASAGGHAMSAQSLARLAKSGALEGITAPHTLVPFVAEAAAGGDSAAIEWLETQAGNGVTPAALAIAAVLLQDGDRATEAVAMLQDLAERGQAEAQYLLGEAFSTGTGAPQDFVQAHKWLNLAAARGHAKAAESRNVLTDLMTAEQVSMAQDAARAFVEKAPESGTDN